VPRDFKCNSKILSGGDYVRFNPCVFLEKWSREGREKQRLGPAEKGPYQGGLFGGLGFVVK
jgi:hypothetical protein